MKTDWLSFWDRSSHVYVSKRHVEAHYSTIAKDVNALVSSGAILLDWGCGEGFGTSLLIEHGIQVFLYDPAPTITARLAERFKDVPGVTVLTSDTVYNTLHKFDVILVNSVLQYVSKPGFKELLPQFHDLLKETGTLYLGDVVTPNISMIDDTTSLLTAAIRHGFFFSAIWGLVRTFFSEYRTIRKVAGFTLWEEDEITEVLKERNFSAQRMPKNIGLAPHRMLIAAKPVL